MKRTPYRQRRKLRRVKTRVKTLTQEVSKKDQKIKVLKERKAIIEVDVKLRKLLPEYAPKEEAYTLDEYCDLISPHVKAICWPSSDTYVRKRGIARVREEVSREVNPLLEKVVFDDDYDTFLEKNKLLLWVYICCVAHGVQVAATQKDQDKAWNVTEFEEEYTRYTVELWVLVGWKQRGRAFKFTSLLTRTFSVADVPVSAEFIEAPFQFMAFETPPFVYAPLVEDDGIISRSPVYDILVGYVPEEDNGNIKTLAIVATPSKCEAPSFVHAAHFDTRLTIQQNIENACGEEDVTDVLQIKKVLNFVCNAILYCTSFPDDTVAHNASRLEKLRRRAGRAGKKHKDAAQKLARATRDTIYLVGNSFSLDDKRVAEELSQEDHKPGLRHIVRGHWRNQACGPGHTRRRLVFVQPFWRGSGRKSPDKTYVVK